MPLQRFAVTKSVKTAAKNILLFSNNSQSDSLVKYFNKKKEEKKFVERIFFVK